MINSLESFAQEKGKIRASNQHHRVWKAQQRRYKMVLVRDVGLEEVVRISLKTLVGKFGYRSINNNDISRWVEDNCKPILGYNPMISM